VRGLEFRSVTDALTPQGSARDPAAALSRQGPGVQERLAQGYPAYTTIHRRAGSANDDDTRFRRLAREGGRARLEIQAEGRRQSPRTAARPAFARGGSGPERRLR